MNETKNFERFYNSITKLGEYPPSISEIKHDLKYLKPDEIISNETWLKNHDLVFIYSSNIGKVTSILELIFKCKPGFYLYFGKEENEEDFTIKIVHKPSQLNEVKFYINGLKKIK